MVIVKRKSKTPKTTKELVGNPHHPAWKEFDASWEKTQNDFLKKHGMNLTEKQQHKLDDMYEKAEKKFIEMIYGLVLHNVFGCLGPRKGSRAF